MSQLPVPGFVTQIHGNEGVANINNGTHANDGRFVADADPLNILESPIDGVLG